VKDKEIPQWEIDPAYLASLALLEELLDKGIPDYNLEAQSDKDADKKEI